MVKLEYFPLKLVKKSIVAKRNNEGINWLIYDNSVDYIPR